jgi:hypothetical protein
MNGQVDDLDMCGYIEERVHGWVDQWIGPSSRECQMQK